jgi:RHS repeat-associated protein
MPGIVYQHDRFGNVVKEAAHNLESDVRVGGMVLCYDYDAMGRLMSISLDNSQNQVEIPWGTDLKEWVRDMTCERDPNTHKYTEAAEFAAFRYDYKGRRVFQRYYAEPDKYFVFDKQDNLLAELANEGTTIREYVWIGLKPVAQIVYGEMAEQNPPGCTPGGSCTPTQCSMTGTETGPVGQTLFYVFVFVVAPGLGYVVVRRGRGEPAGKKKRSAVLVVSMIGLGAVALVFLQCTPTTYAKPVVFYYHNDHLETPMKMTGLVTSPANPNQTLAKVAWEVTKKYPFGDFTYATYNGTYRDAVGNDQEGVEPQNNLRFPGQYDGTDVRYYLNQGFKGPYYNWHRWYNPGTGRYMAKDPIGILTTRAQMPMFVLAGKKQFAVQNGALLFDENMGVGAPVFLAILDYDFAANGPYSYSGSNPVFWYDADGQDRITWLFVGMNVAGGICMVIPGGQGPGAIIIVVTTAAEAAYYGYQLFGPTSQPQTRPQTQCGGSGGGCQ